MARIPDGVIERLKETVSIERLAEARGVVLKKHGSGDLIGQCPFHDDKTPSLVITPAKNLWHCLGACQAGGTVIDWVMRAEGVSFRHAVELLQDDALPLVAASSASTAAVKRSTVKKLPTALPRDAEDAKLLSQVIDYYHQTLLQSPEALDYLAKRGLSSSEAIKHFRLGFANRTLGYRVPEAPRVTPAAHMKPLGAEREYELTFADRRYRVRGLEKNASFECLRVNVLASRAALDALGEAVHVDTLDLYQARHRQAFIKAAAAELGVAEEVIKADLGKVLLALEAEQEEVVPAAPAP